MNQWLIFLDDLKPKEHKELVSLLQDLETESNAFMTSSCLAPPRLSFGGPQQRKTCFAASVSGLWFALTSDGQLSSYLHPVSAAQHSAGKRLDGVLFS